MKDSERIVRAFFDAVTAGELPDAMLTEDMTAWTTTQGQMSKQAYQGVIRILRKISSVPLTFIVDSVTAEEDRICAELHSHGVLINGETYENTYFFAFRVRDGRIAHVSEHFNALIVQEKMMPLVGAAAP
jgi:ketosteroid isomerase-like protein